jgi:hypothetical protein
MSGGCLSLVTTGRMVLTLVSSTSNSGSSGRYASATVCRLRNACLGRAAGGGEASCGMLVACGFCGS